MKRVSKSKIVRESVEKVRRKSAPSCHDLMQDACGSFRSGVKDLATNKKYLRIADLRDLQRIPGIGPSLAQDLADLGIRCVTDLRRRSPERLYERLCAMRGRHIDRCVLYTFRCAVYFASESQPDPELLKWWNWKDK